MLAASMQSRMWCGLGNCYSKLCEDLYTHKTYVTGRHSQDELMSEGCTLSFLDLAAPLL